MVNFIREGGFPMFFLLAFGLVAMGLAARFALRPSQRALRTALAMAAATACTSVTGVCHALWKVGHHVPRYLERHPETNLAELAMLGAAESLTPGILGFTMLSLIALILALGLHRHNPV